MESAGKFRIPVFNILDRHTKHPVTKDLAQLKLEIVPDIDKLPLNRFHPASYRSRLSISAFPAVTRRSFPPRSVAPFAEALR